MYSAALLITAAIFVADHGGIAGDAAASQSAKAFNVLFHRWELRGFGDEPIAYRVFYYLNVPAIITAKLAYFVLQQSTEEFRSELPYGVPFRMYEHSLFWTFGLLQWYAVGWWIDRYWPRRAVRRK